MIHSKNTNPNEALEVGFRASDHARKSNGAYSAPGSVSHVKPAPVGRPPKPKPAKDTRQIGKEKATLVMLVRNSELKDALGSMKQIEDRFNRHYQYPWTFLNDEPFTEGFKNHTTRMASGTTEYGLIPKEQWSMPDWISEDKFQKVISKMSKENVIYGDSRTYRHMCRYNSGFFFRDKLLAKYDWYWRVEPSIGFYCDMTYDLFTFMRENKKRYSFVISLPEYLPTVETLWKTTQEFAKLHPEHIARNNSLGFIATDPDKGIQETDYNLCHFWSNFEIADLNFWRGEAYQKYFEFLDKKGGFYYERWGDAPVHSIAAALFLPRDQIHFFGDVGYKHVPWGRCPLDDESHDTARCMCPFDRKESFDYNQWSCQNKWNKFCGLPENPIYE
ncbi:glycolipid 2-alpha-mannosyltransferase-domain-containing protein [Tuber indicum]|nr:glycolipid 2-alpha-mannosyltransferase-domain-containing protein [Tuber indicum]